MRKLLAIIAAILLAFLVTTGIFAWRGMDVSKEGLMNLIKNFRKPAITQNLPHLPTEPKDTNLSYDERLKKGDYYFEQGFFTFASNEYVKAANLEPNRIDPYLKLLKTNFELRDYQKALFNAEIALKIDPNHLETRFNVIRIHIKLSEFDKAKALLEAYPKTDPADPRVLYYKGLLSTLFKDNESAVKYLKQAQSASKDPILNSHIKVVLDAYQEFNFTQAAEPIYEAELLAKSLNKATEYEMAIHILKEVLKSRTDLRDGWILLGFAYLNLENYQFALTTFEKAYSLDSEWATTHYFLGITHKELGHFEDSIKFFNLALSNGFEPKLVILQNLADLYFTTKDYKNSADTYEKVLEMSKNDITSFVRPVWLYLDFLNDPNKALKLAETAVLNFPNSAMSYNLLGWSYTGLKDEKKAEENLKKSISLDPTLAAAHYNLGNLYKENDQNQLALDEFQKAYTLDPNGSIGNLAATAHNELLKK